jgi:NAD dependent epimerase/dehydratase family enzyme
LPVPSFGPKLLLGSELADALLFTGQKVMPKILQSTGFAFKHPDLESALRSLLNKPN